MVSILTLLDKIPIHESLIGKFLTFVSAARKNVYVIWITNIAKSHNISTHYIHLKVISSWSNGYILRSQPIVRI